jgi:hypothetical protein
VITRIWTSAFGLLSILIVGYFWLLMLVPIAWNLRFPGGGFALVAILLLSIIVSGIAGLAGSRRWYLVTIAAVGTFLFLGFRMD